MLLDMFSGMMGFRMKWVCQSNLGKSDDVEAIKRACGKYGHTFEGVEVIPFSDDLPDVDNGVPTIFYGATKWIERIHEKGDWAPGTFLNPSSVCSVWMPIYGDMVLNNDGVFARLGSEETVDIAKKLSCDGLVFVRPDRDNKAFNGQLVREEEILVFSGKVHGTDLDGEPIMISSPRNIEKEWRLWVLDGKIVSGSQYRRRSRLDISTGYPVELIDMVKGLCNLYSPSRVFVMDFGLYQGDYKVIEIGCFNSAGFYAANIESIIGAVSNAFQ